MTGLAIEDGALADAEPLLDHLLQHGSEEAGVRISEVMQALEILRSHPLIGRAVGAGHRELVIGKRARGYVALYRYLELDDLVIVLALRAQREAGFVDR